MKEKEFKLNDNAKLNIVVLVSIIFSIVMTLIIIKVFNFDKKTFKFILVLISFTVSSPLFYNISLKNISENEKRIKTITGIVFSFLIAVAIFLLGMKEDNGIRILEMSTVTAVILYMLLAGIFLGFITVTDRILKKGKK